MDCPTRTIRFKKLKSNAQVPTYATPGAACFDFYACLDEPEVTIPPHSTVKIGTGLAFGLTQGYVLFLYSRSGHGFKHGIRFVNCVGVIDSDYRGEILVGLHNDSDEAYTISQGERIAQGIVQSYLPCHFVEVSALDATERGEGGFGSTGK